MQPSADARDVNHYVLTTGGDQHSGSHADCAADMCVRNMLKHRSCFSYSSIDARGEIAAYYAEQGRAVQFTEAFGNCAPDTIVLHEGLSSTPSTWRMIRHKVANAMCELRHKLWFREAFKSAAEFDHEECSSELSDPGVWASGGEGAEEDEAAAEEQEEIDENVAGDEASDTKEQDLRRAMSHAISFVSHGSINGAALGDDTLDKHIKKLSADDVLDILSNYGKGALKRPRNLALPKNKSTLLSIRRTIGEHYRDFLEGRGD